MLSLITPVLAQDIELKPKADSGFSSLAEDITVPSIIAGALTLALVVAAVVFFFMLVIGGIRWMVSGGDKTQTETARNQITAALIGLVVVFAAWAIARLIGIFFGVEFLGEGGFGVKLPTGTQ